MAVIRVCMACLVVHMQAPREQLHSDTRNPADRPVPELDSLSTPLPLAAAKSSKPAQQPGNKEAHEDGSSGMLELSGPVSGDVSAMPTRLAKDQDTGAEVSYTHAAKSKWPCCAGCA